jgi:hypothetical protein
MQRPDLGLHLRKYCGRARNHARALACAKGGEGMYGPGRLHAALAVPLGDAEHLCTAIALG